MTLLGHGQHVGTRASDLLDGRLSGAEEVRLRAHIGQCPPCARAVHREQQVRSTLRAAGADQLRPTRDLMAGLMALPGLQSTGPFVGAPGLGSFPGPGAPQPPRRGSSVLLGAAVLGTVSLATAGVLGPGALPAPGTAAVRWGEAASASLTRSTPDARTTSDLVRTSVGAVVLTGTSIERVGVRGAP